MTSKPCFDKAARDAAKKSHRTFHLGEEIFQEGDPGHEAYLILDGTVEIRKGMKSSAPKTLAVLGKGDIIGEIALIDSRERSASAVAMDDTVVSVLTRDDFEKRSADMDPLLKAVYGVTVKRLRESLEGKKAADPAATLVNWRT